MEYQKLCNLFHFYFSHNWLKGLAFCIILCRRNFRYDWIFVTYYVKYNIFRTYRSIKINIQYTWNTFLNIKDVPENMYTIFTIYDQLAKICLSDSKMTFIKMKVVDVQKKYLWRHAVISIHKCIIKCQMALLFLLANEKTAY